MRRGQHTRILHMALEIPELLEPDAADVDDIIRRDDGRLRVRSAQRRAHRHDEAQEVLVQREQTQQTLGLGGRRLRFVGEVRFAQRFGVRGHVLGVQVFDFEDVDGDSAAVATAGPLGVLVFIACG